MPNLPKISHLRVFEAIILHGSVRAAAKALNQTQPGITRTLKELETTLGATLMVRGTRGMVLTDMGRLFETRMKFVLNELERAVDEIKQVNQSQHGTVSFGCSHLKTLSIIPSVMQRIHKMYPKAQISLYEGQQSELLPSLRVGRLDFFIGIISEEISLGEFVEEPLLSCPFGVIARKGHPLANSTSLAELRNAKWYLPVAGAGYYHDLELFLFPEGKGPENAIFKGDSIAVGERLVLEADYLVIGPLAMLDIDFVNKLFCTIPVKEKLPDGHYSLLYRQDSSLTPLAKHLINEIRIECGKQVIQRVN
ncbi:LysR family transcriptional regulator [Chania multitudinisentens RB-25]|uniref:LysR family transcriptional regulator n=1 Tax=Chania multitudinisentens RB-25 TaxID=1441930 RepID=W0LB20_9GAMM|nr:LysR substrate-binding domain-containing protein [Chania multitudinisentens]AHG21043.1 LysR family transcriptional regulator [Chania multitudinisentens RB-25]